MDWCSYSRSRKDTRFERKVWRHLHLPSCVSITLRSHWSSFSLSSSSIINLCLLSLFSRLSGAITTGANSKVVLTGGLTGASVYWVGATNLVGLLPTCRFRFTSID